MLFMCVMIGLLILAVAGIGFWFYMQFFSNQFLQDSSEKVALSAAQKLNEHNYAGKLNELTGHSREMVFTARAMHEKSLHDPSCVLAQQLAAYVVDESRQGATMLAEERQNFANSTVADLRQMIKEQKVDAPKEYSLFNAAAKEGEIIDFRIGTLDKMESNARAPLVDDLAAYDRNQNYLIHGKDYDFYKANIPLTLPSPDHDLDFTMSPLPIDFGGTSSPLRLTSADHFKTTMVLRENGQDTKGSIKVIPSCVQVLMNVQLKSKVSDKLESATASRSTACTNGAVPESVQ